MKFKKKLIIIMLGVIGNILMIGYSSNSQSSQQAVVTRIIDGDTIDVSMENCRLYWKGNPNICRVRLACIDTPERGQEPFFKDAKKSIETLIPPGTKISLRDTGKSSYNRIVAEIFLHNQSVNLHLVKEGKGVVYCKYLNNCQGTKQRYLKAEVTAKKQGLGVWNSANPWQNIREPDRCSN